MSRKTIEDRLRAIAAEIEAIQKQDELSADDIAALEAKMAEVTELEAKLKTLDAAEEVRARLARPATERVADDNNNDPAPATPAVKLKPAEKVGLLATAMVVSLNEDGRRGVRPACDILEKQGYGELAAEIHQGNFVGGRQRTLNSSSASPGGVLLPENMDSDIIDLLRPNTTFLAAQPVIIPMPNGTYKQPAGASGATAAYRGETVAMSVSQPSFKAISMSAKLLAGIVPMSNQLIRWSLPNVRQWVERDLSAAMGTVMDLACYRGDGTGDTPLGITNIPGVYSVAATGGTTPTYTQTDADAKKLELVMENNNLPLLQVAWVMAPRIKKYLQDLRDGNGMKIYPSLDGDNPRWRDRPVLQTTQIPTNLGGTTDESEIYLVAFGHVLYGDAMRMQLAASDVATVVNGAQTINSFQDGVTVIKAELEHDVDIRYLQAVNMLTGVRWGA